MKITFTFMFFLSLISITNAQSDLAKAIYYGRISEVKSYLSDDFDINALHINEEYTCLNFAIKTNQIEIVLLLLKNNANTNLQSNGKSPLMYAAKYGHFKIAKLLLENGADKMLTNEKGRTALDYAKKYEQEEMMELLK